jgi:hypothetical protein
LGRIKEIADYCETDVVDAMQYARPHADSANVNAFLRSSRFRASLLMDE